MNILKVFKILPCKHETFKVLAGRCEKFSENKWAGQEIIQCESCLKEGMGEMYETAKGEDRYRTIFKKGKSK